jgi:hypothetical protein
MRRPVPVFGFAISAVALCGSVAIAQTSAPPSLAGTAVPVLGGGLAPGQDAPPTSKAGAVAAQLTYIRRDHWDCADFSRKSDATWSANRAVVFPAPDGLLKIDQGAIYRIGQFYGGYDLAAMLEHDCPKG